MEPQKKTKQSGCVGVGTTKKTKKTKDTKKMLLGGGTTKETKKNKRHKKNVERWNHKKTKQSGCVGVLNALARSVTKAPKLKKT